MPKSKKDENRFPSAVRSALKKLPESAGVYQFFDEKGKLLYIGKAKCLKKRVRQYFQKSAHHSPKTKKLIAAIRDIRWITVENEAEALALEANLVHEHRPPFNILLRDDKHFLYVHITDDVFPRVCFTRHMRKGKGTFFGPYVKASAIRKTIDFLREILMFRTCRVDISPEGTVLKNPENKKIPCLDFQVRRCTAPCDARISLEEYHNNIATCTSFLRGNTASFAALLHKKMKQAAEKKEFERAARFRDILLSLENASMRQIASLPEDFSADVIGFFYGVQKSFACIFFVRHGKIIRQEQMQMGNEGSEAETFSAFLREFLAASADIPPLLLLPPLAESEKKGMEAFAAHMAKKTVEVRIPQRGNKKKLLDLAQKNAALQAANSKASFEEEDVLAQLQRALSLPRRPERIECYDISHISGTHTVASQVVFLGGEPEKKEYRTYKIHAGTPGSPDDFAGMEEVLTRRLRRLSHLHTELKMKRQPLKKKEEEKEKYNFFTSNGEKVGEIERKKYGSIWVIEHIFCEKKYSDRFGEEEVLRHFLTHTSDRRTRICVGKTDVRRHVFLKRLECTEEKKPPKALSPLLHNKKKGKNTSDENIIFVHKKEKKSASHVPDLLVIDGGKGQLSSAVRVLKKMNLFTHIPVCSLAKREEEVFVPGKSLPIALKKSAAASELLQRIRDEAHRFAIQFHRNLRKKAETKSQLDDIPGIGEKTKAALFRTFGSVENMVLASDEKLKKYMSSRALAAFRERIKESDVLVKKRGAKQKA